MSDWRDREGLPPAKAPTEMARSALEREVATLRKLVDYQARVFCDAHKPYGDETPNGHGCPCCVALAATSREHGLVERVEQLEAREIDAARAALARADALLDKKPRPCGHPFCCAQAEIAARTPTEPR